MPWREAARPSSASYIADPNVRGYSCLVSEVMLQQTQVATVVDYYTRWMARWPSVKHLAASTLEEVQEAWSGLGYYSRGRRLREAAVFVTEKLDGETEVNISPKISISAQPLNMALHRNPAMHGSRMVIFLHDSKKSLFKHD